MENNTYAEKEQTETSIIEERIKTEFLMEYKGNSFNLSECQDILKNNGFEIIYRFSVTDSPLFIIKYKGDDISNIAEYVSNIENESGNMLKVYSNLEKTALGVKE